METCNRDLLLTDMCDKRDAEALKVFRRRVCESCDWSERVFYYKLKGTTPIKKSEIYIIKRIDKQLSKQIL